MAAKAAAAPKPIEVTTPGETDVVVVRTFAAPRDLVFQCFTKPEHIRRWLLGPPGWTMPVCEVDLRVGGRLRYEWSGPEGQSMAVTGTFHEIVPGERIVHTEKFDDDWQGGGSRVITEFTEARGMTTVTMTIRFGSAKAREAAVATGMTRGMALSYDLLDDLISSLAAGTGDHLP